MTRLDIAVLAVVGGILVFLLFVPPVAGLADQSDYGRIMNAFNIDYPVEMTKDDRYFCYLHTKYPISAVRKPGRSRMPYFSSELLFVGAAVVLHSIVTTSSDFDIRLLGCVHAAAFLGALSLILYGTRHLGQATKMLLAGLLVFIFADAGYIVYFNSFFSEPASFIFGLAFVGSALLLIQAAPRTLWHLSLFTIAAALLVAAKSQNMPLAVVIAAFIWFCVRRLQPTFRLWSVACLVSVCLLLGVAVTSYLRAPDTRYVGLYNFIFGELLVHSPNPQADLHELGLSAELDRYVGTRAWRFERGSPPSYFPGKANLIRILRIYLYRPSRFLGLVQRAAADSLSNRYHDLGNFELTSGKPCRSHVTSFVVWDKVRSQFNNVWLLALFFSANLSVPIWIGRGLDGQMRFLLHFLAMFAFLAIASFLIAILGDSNETKKHLFLFNFLFDCCLIADLLWLCSRAFGLGKQSTSRFPRDRDREPVTRVELPVVGNV